MQFCFYPALPVGLLDDDLLTVLPAESCPYLPSRQSRLRGFVASRLTPSQYHRLMDRGFRRSGTFFYQPICRGCRECIPIRVPVASFTPSKTQRRISRRNQDLRVEAGPPRREIELIDLFQRYQRDWHGEDKTSWDEAHSFLFDSPVETLVFTYSLGARVVAVGICDASEASLSSVYFYFDPEERGRSLGTFGAIAEMEYARRAGIPYYYLGYWVRDCAAMTYKANFRPYELLGPDGGWRLITSTNASNPTGTPNSGSGTVVST